MKMMEEKKETTDASSPSVLKPFVNAGVAGLFTSSLFGAADYKVFKMLNQIARYRNHMPTYVPRCINAKMIPGMVLIDTFTYSQQLGIYEILRRRAVATNEGMRPTLYQDIAFGLAAGAAGEYLSHPLALACYNKQVESMGPIAEPFRLRSKWSNVLRDGSFEFKPRIGLGLGMLASYNPSFHYLRESQGFCEEVAMIGAGAISALSAVVCASLEKAHANSLDFALEFHGVASKFLDSIVAGERVVSKVVMKEKPLAGIKIDLMHVKFIQLLQGS